MSDVDKKIAELRNVLRIVENTLNFMAETDVKGGDVFAVAEIIQWQQAFKKQLETQIDAILPLQGSDKKDKVVDAQVVEAVKQS